MVVVSDGASIIEAQIQVGPSAVIARISIHAVNIEPKGYRVSIVVSNVIPKFLFNILYGNLIGDVRTDIPNLVWTIQECFIIVWGRRWIAHHGDEQL